MSHEVAVRGAVTKLETRSGWAAPFVIEHTVTIYVMISGCVFMKQHLKLLQLQVNFEEEAHLTS